MQLTEMLEDGETQCVSVRVSVCVHCIALCVISRVAFVRLEVVVVAAAAAAAELLQKSCTTLIV